VHPEFASEQKLIEHAYACLEEMRASARRLQYSVESSAGGTHQARFERDVTFDKAHERLAQLQLGTESLVFGRIDQIDDERFYIGRLPVSDQQQNPVVVDWRAPVAAAFYRATGKDPQGLIRRRHFATEGPVLLSIDDEVFDADALERGGDDLVGSAALLSALGRARSGHMRDIVATIQAEQDEIIRGDLPGIVVVQGGPGTGKTAVALHRASYLLYTHRFPLERQGVLVVGPNRLFMRYIGRVLPSLGETGVEMRAVDDLVTDLVHDVTIAGVESHAGSRVKGDERMARVIRRAVTTRQRPLKTDLTVGFGLFNVRLTAAETADVIQIVKRGHRLHNPSRKQLIVLLVERLHLRYVEAVNRSGRNVEDRNSTVPYETFSATVRKSEEFKVAVDRMWPLLTPAILLRDLYGATALIRAASKEILTDAEQKLLERARGSSLESYPWTNADVPLLDEAALHLGPVDAKHADDHLRTYGHIVVDEAQDLSPMQLRMLARRSLNGSMTIVGDIGQATGMWAPADWPEITRHLPARRPIRRVELTVGYRTPAEIMAVAARVLEEAAPSLTVPKSVRSTGEEPIFVHGRGDDIESVTVQSVTAMQRALEDGTIGVIVPDALVVRVGQALVDGGIAASADGLSDGVSLVPVSRVKGLEFDGVVVVEPSRIVRDAPQGLRALFVALTRSTRSLTVAYTEDLPACLSSND
jgi:DNA helicase IV